MESPERNPQTLDREAQGSPTFSFLCTLSPIKPLKTAHSAQTFADIGFSAAPTASTLVKARRGDSRSSKRVNCKIQADDAQASVVDAQNHGISSGGIENYEFSTKDDNIKKYSVESFGKTTEENSQHKISKNGSVSSAGEEGINAFSKSVNSIDVPEASIDPENDGSCRESITNVENGHCNNIPQSFDESVETEGIPADGSDHSQMGVSDGESLQITKSLGYSQATTNIECGEIKKLLDFDQDMSELEFMMLGDEDKPYQQMHMGDGETHISSNLRGPSIEEVEGYIATLKDVVNENQEVLETNSSAGLSKHHGNSQLETYDSALELKDNDSHSVCRENGLSQRGVRRRCLNFNMLDCRPIKTESSERTPDAAMTTVSMPSGIGLHLNSLTRTMTFPRTRKSSGREGSSTLIRQASSVQSLLTPESQEPLTLLRGLPRISKQDSKFDFVERTKMDSKIDSVERTNMGDQDGEMLCSDSIADSLKAATGIAYLEDVAPSARMPCPLGRKRVSLPGMPDPEGSNQMVSSPPKKRRKTSTEENPGDGCKRCNCKKSKCLKLYCECFAAGVYCVDSCSCQGCFNKPESENIVMETRKQIESRNPLAFAPKIIRTETSPTRNKEAGHEIPPGRHKRGCNCKRSHCLKKYCECYQAGVGCSEGCRCENCKNTYGRKSGPEVRDEKKTHSDDPHKNIDASDLSDQNAETSRQQIASPITPSFDMMQSSTAVTSNSSNKKCPTTPEGLHTPDFSLPSRSPSRLLRSCTKGSQRGSPNITTSRTVSSTPRILRIGNHWERLADVTPASKAPCKPSFPESSLSVSGRFHHFSDFHLQNIPTTPVFSSPVSRCYRESGATDSQRLDSAEDDESCTPEFLGDPQVNEAGFLPVCLLNSSSPRHKRVSPPHFHGPRGQVQKTNSCIRNGRKFILQSVPALPVTPCIVDGMSVNAGCGNLKADT